MAVKRKRGRPRKSESRASSSTTPRELPPVAIVAGEPSTTDEAIAALDHLEPADISALDQVNAEPPDAGDGAVSSPATGRADAAALSPDRTRDRTPAPAPELETKPASTNGTHAPAKPKEVSITGKRFAGMDRSSLRTALAITTNENEQLKAQLRDIVPAAAAAKVVALEKMTAVVCSALFDLAALATSVDEVRLDRDEETELGELGAPAVGPYLGEYAKHAPLLAFGSKLTTVIITKVLIVKAAKEQAKRDG
jgi:hypothetical protein